VSEAFTTFFWIVATMNGQAVEFDSFLRLQLPNDDMGQLDFGDAKLMDPLFNFPFLSHANLSNHQMTTTNNQHSKKRELSLSFDSLKLEGPPPTKKSKSDSSPSSTSVLAFRDPHPARFRNYQADQWTEKFEELCQFVKKSGHCLVPNSLKENPPLAHWTKRRK
jgi:hypothetical protein